MASSDNMIVNHIRSISSPIIFLYNDGTVELTKVCGNTVNGDVHCYFVFVYHCSVRGEKGDNTRYRDYLVLF